MTIVAIMTVRTTEADAFRAFEHGAAEIMAGHGGAIERTVVAVADPPGETFREIHIVTFPDADAFAAYRSDARLREVTGLRERAVIATELIIGEDGPEYGSAAGE